MNYIEFMKKHASSATQQELKEMRKQRKRFIFEDYRNWITKILDQTERQLSKHDTRAAYRTIKLITGKQRPKGMKKLTADSVQNTTERLSEWLRYHTDFQQTQHENYELEIGKWPTINPTAINLHKLHRTHTTRAEQCTILTTKQQSHRPRRNPNRNLQSITTSPIAPSQTDQSLLAHRRHRHTLDHR